MSRLYYNKPYHQCLSRSRLPVHRQRGCVSWDPYSPDYPYPVVISTFKSVMTDSIAYHHVMTRFYVCIVMTMIRAIQATLIYD